MKTELNDIPAFSIGKTAKMLNVSVHTLRMYEREGLIIPFKTPGRQRMYSIEDVERLRCIRKSINEEKISIGGMKRIFGMIPCYDIIKCTQEERNACPVFKSHFGGCWTYDHTHSVCATKDCRTCDVYKLSSDCGQIKDLIFRSSLAPQTEQPTI
ncbi:MAG: MerR family transcriptional regulator [Bacteroidota bacterium]